MTCQHTITVFINNNRHPVPAGNICIHKLKSLSGGCEHDDVFIERGRVHPISDTCCGDIVSDSALHELHHDVPLVAEMGQCFWVRRKIKITINNKHFKFRRRCVTGEDLKSRASIALDDVLFLHGHEEDQVITNDSKVQLEPGQCFHSAPPANYGAAELASAEVGSPDFQMVEQPGGWKFLILQNFKLPKTFSPSQVQLLVKLPPTFPDAAPDMFWVNPPVRVSASGLPQGTCMEPLLGESWQRFSWHLQSGAWRPGSSTLRDFMRCVRARLERQN